MGYKILDVKADIHEDVERYLDGLHTFRNGEGFSYIKIGKIKTEVLDIIDKHFEKIER
jgi:hypothetical protein